MKRLPQLTALVFSLLPVLLVGCSEDDTAPAPASTTQRYACDNRSKESTCADFAAGTSRADAAGSCDGVLLETTCPRDGVVGSCAVTTARGALGNVYYASGTKTWTVEAAEAACGQARGTFTR